MIFPVKRICEGSGSRWFTCLEGGLGQGIGAGVGGYNVLAGNGCLRGTGESRKFQAE